MSRIRIAQGRRGFTLVELMVVVAIIAVLASLLLPAIQSARETANRSKCQNNMRNLGIAVLNFESARGHLPRSGEHIANVGGTDYKTQDLQSTFTLLLPFIEQEALYASYNLQVRYNETGQNQTVAQSVIPLLLCPTNPLRGDRVNGAQDSSGYGAFDYATIPYCQLAADGSAAPGATFWPCALTGSQYPSGLYQTFPAPGDTSVSGSKLTQLDSAGNPGQIDAMAGSPHIADIRDGTSNTVLFYEDVGQNEKMREPASAGGAYYDPIDDQASLHWRWANPDCASGISALGLNANKNATYTTPDPNGSGCTWEEHDCGPNSEAFSFHPGGVNMVFADAHVQFINETTSNAVVRALATRDQATGGSDAGVTKDAKLPASVFGQ